jgi:ubiquinone biosynthesis protein
MVVKEEIENLNRMQEIVEVLMKAGFSETLDHTGLRKKVPVIQRLFKDYEAEPSPQRLRKAFEKLGPTFIKLGQILAQRPDLIPQTYVKELEKLEDEVEQVDGEKIVEILEQSLGKDKDDVFKEFNMEPVASASIAQVHRATLKNGDDVAVKVIKPGVKESIETDLRILRRLVREAEFASSYLRKIHFREIFEQFDEWTRNEIDLTREARNAIRLKKNLRNDDEAYIPEIYWDYTTEEVMVLEFVDGVKIDDIDALNEQELDIDQIASNGITLIIKQVFRDGFFHGDPHPANLMVDEEGRINYLDFGIVGSISPKNRRFLALMLLKVINFDPEGVVTSITKIADVDKDADIDSFTNEVEKILLEAQGATISEHPFSFVFLKIVRTAADHGIILPTQLIAGGKALVQVEGIGLTISPDFSPTEELKSAIERIILQQNRPQDIGKNLAVSMLENRELIENAPQNINEVLESLKGLNQLSLEKSIDIGAKEMAGAIFASVLILSGSLILTLSSEKAIQILAITEIVFGFLIGVALIKASSYVSS